MRRSTTLAPANACLANSAWASLRACRAAPHQAKSVIASPQARAITATVSGRWALLISRAVAIFVHYRGDGPRGKAACFALARTARRVISAGALLRCGKITVFAVFPPVSLIVQKY